MVRFVLALLLCLDALAEGDAARWVEQFSFKEPRVESSGVCAGQIGALPSFEVTADAPGRRLVRVSLPFAPGALPVGLCLEARHGDQRIAADVRVLTRHPGTPASARRSLVTFPFEFTDTASHQFTLSLIAGLANPQPRQLEKVQEGQWHVTLGSVSVELSADRVRWTYLDKTEWDARLAAPDRTRAEAPVVEAVEWGQHYCWVRLLEPDDTWPRILEVRADALGAVTVQAHLQRLEKGDGTAPDLGWEISGPQFAANERHAFANGEPCTLASADSRYSVEFPIAPFDRRGSVSVAADGAKAAFLRCSRDDHVPFQQAAWRRAAFVVSPNAQGRRTPLLEPAMRVRIPCTAFDSVYHMGEPTDLALWPVLDELRWYTHRAIEHCRVTGDDFGNVTAFQPGQPAPAFGMNRLNHCPAIFEAAWRHADATLREVALTWCENMYDLSLWWADEPTFGGTRYNNATAGGSKDHENDTSFMWRQNNAVHFCTKGADSFLCAYEETGDPRMAIALNAQTAYAAQYVHTDQGECRNIGDVADFMNLYRSTGITSYRDEALRLFRELRTKLSTGDLFSQGGKPIIEDGPFIDDDAHGYQAPFAKPYIIGYALAGLPDLLREFPDEPKLREVVRAVADFLARSQDPTGGWRYPHPRSTRMMLDQAMEHASQLARAAAVLESRGEPVDALLDAIERTLQARVNAFGRTGQILSGLQGWEANPGGLKDGQTVYDLYKKPADRDPGRDYTEGPVSVGGASPEGLVYFEEVLAFYLAHRPAERLSSANATLAAVLARTVDQRLKLTPQDKGSYLRVARPDHSDIGFTLWAPEWATFPPLGYGPEELGGMNVAWQTDAATGAVTYAIDRKEGRFTASFEPHLEYVACTYTAWPKPGADVPGQFGVGPCQQMKAGVFESDDADLMNRLWFIADGRWVAIGSCANGNARNVQYVKGADSPEESGAMAESGWKTIQSPRPDVPLIACVSRDGKWIAATAAECSTCLCNNANASHRCMHSQASTPLRKDGPTSLRVHAYLFEGTLDDLKARYARDVARWKTTAPTAASGEVPAPRHGVRADLPSFRDAQVARLTFPLSWAQAGLPFPEWRGQARKAYLDCLSPRPPAALFAAQVIGVEDRGGYEARKLALNLSADDRVMAYLLVPKGPGPFPAILALHDHGAHFSIGKEKVIRPFDEPKERLHDAEDWVGKCYGGKFIGDELAQHGYVVFAADALFWGDRGRLEGVAYEAQQTLAANMFQLGLSWAGRIVWDDVRSAEFVQGLPEVDPGRIGCVGLSMGAHRTWSLAAATDIIQAGAAICWMGDTPTLTAEGNNQTKGQSAFSMLHPGLRGLLDYADVASIACPKPMLFYNGDQDGLFPVPGVQACYAKLHRVWHDRNVEDRLETKLWPVPHEFNEAMQRDAFTWLDRWLKK